MIGFLVGRWRFGNTGRSRVVSFAWQLRLGFRDGMPCVVIRIVFIFRAVVGDALNHDFGIVAASEGALRIGPIVLGLAFVVAWHLPWAFLVVS